MTEDLDSDSDSDPTRPTAVRYRVYALAGGASFLLYLHRYTWNFVGPKLGDEYHLSIEQVTFLFSLFYYTYASGQIPSGVLVDRYGPHKFLSVMMVAWSAAMAVLGQTASLLVLGLSRLLFGAAQAGCYPALSKVTRNWTPPARRTVIQGWIATTSGRAGGAMSPIILGTILMGWFGLSWQNSLALLGSVGVAFALIFWRTFRNVPGEHPGVNRAERALIEGGDGRSIAPATAVLSARRALGSRDLRFFAAQQFLDAGSDVAFVALIGTYFLKARGFDIGKAGWLTSLPLWGGAVGGIAGGWLNDFFIARTGSRRWSRSGVGFVGKVLGCGLLLFVVRQEDGRDAALFLMAAKFFGDWSQPTTWGACTDLGGRFSATVFGIINTAGTLGGVVMPLVFGKLLVGFTTHATVVGGKVVATTNWGPLFTLLASMYLASGVCWLLVDCTRTLDGENPAKNQPIDV